jgi:signal peptidase
MAMTISSEVFGPVVEVKRDAKGAAREAVLALGAIVGVIGIVGFIASLAFGVSFDVFRTGSMAPTMPQGALAITVPVAASDLRVGQVVTVPVAGSSLPVTHRIVAIAKDSRARDLTLKGDDNRTADAAPYRVHSARLVVWSAPGIGAIWALLRSPLMIALATVALAALVLWSFWPRGGEKDAR